MAKISELYKSADWKNEKHVPVIDIPQEVKAGEKFEIKVCVGKEVSHPNTTEHHIRWIQVFFKPAGDAAVLELGKIDFNVHGESAKGANKGAAYCDPFASIYATLNESGEILATSYCNIHGIWENSASIIVK